MKKKVKTSAIALAQFSTGLIYGGVGPTLPTLARNVHTTHVSTVFTSRGLGYLAGSLISGSLGEKVNSHLYLFVAMATTCGSMFATPYLTTLAPLMAVFAFVGLLQGSLDTLGNVLLLGMWEERCGPVVQVTKFNFALGAAISPLIASYFLPPGPEAAISCQRVIDNVTNMTSSSVDDVGEPSSVRWAFFIYAALAALTAIFFFAIGCAEKFRLMSPRSRKKSKDQEEVRGERRRVLLVKILLLIFFMLYTGAEASMIGYLFTFATSCRIGLDKDQGVLLNTVFLGSFAVGRFAAIFVAILVTPTKQLLFNLLGVVASSLFLLASFFLPQFAFPLLLIGVAVFGVSIATLFGSCYAWAESRITVTSRTAIVMAVGGSIGEMTIPLLISNSVEISLVFFCVAFAFSELFCFFLLHRLTTGGGRSGDGEKEVVGSSRDDGSSEVKTLPQPEDPLVKT